MQGVAGKVIRIKYLGDVPIQKTCSQILLAVTAQGHFDEFQTRGAYLLCFSYHGLMRVW